MYAKTRAARVKEEALADTLEWLAAPAKWEPKTLARVQFTTGIVAALEAGFLSDRKPLVEAAALLAADQSADGSWRTETEGTLGSAVSYGPVLATYLSRRALEQADAGKYKANIDKATAWLNERKPQNPLDLAAHYLATRAKPSLDTLLRAQATDGSWVREPFDTAIALLALQEAQPKARPDPEIADRIARARTWLLKSQFPEGGWPGTTRPPGGASYAQHISTTGWAAIALAATQ
jgi:squalene cyclase